MGAPTNPFTPTIFTRWYPVPVSSRFIRAMHPKSEIAPTPESMQRILDAGWVAQLKIHGHRAQIHVPADDSQPLVAYTRQGKLHTASITSAMEREIRRLFRPKKGWNALDAEWLKPADKLFVFDILKREDEVLRQKTFPERWKLLPREFLSPRVKVLPILKDLAACLKAMHTSDATIEGLVFKSTTSPGFPDRAIVRCRRRR